MIRTIRYAVEKDQLRQALRITESRLQTSEAVMHSSLDNMLDCFGIYSAVRDPNDGHITDFMIEYVNAAACRNNGMTREQQIGHRLCEILPGHRTSKLFEDYVRVVDTGEPMEKLSLVYADPALGGKPGFVERAFDIRAWKQLDGFAASWRDVTEQIQAEEVLRRQAAIFETQTDAIIVTNLDGHILDFNPAAERMLGYKRDEVLGKTTAMFHRPVEAPTLTKNALETTERDGVWRGEIHFIRKDGTDGVCETVVKPLTDAAGTVVGAVGVNRDISKRRQAEEALKATEARYQAIVESQVEMICRFRPDGTILFVNGAYARARNTTPQALEQANFWDFIEEADRPAVRSLLASLRPDTPEVRIENRFETAQGPRWTLWANRALMFDEQGHALEVQSSGIDITERRLAEERYRTLFESIDEGFSIIEVLFDAHDQPLDYRFVETNDAFERHTGLFQAVGKTARELVPDLDASWFQIYGRVAQTGVAERFENYAPAMQRWFTVHASRVGGADSRLVALVFNNITEQKRTELELRASEARARSVIERSPIGIMIADTRGRIREVNEAFTHILGFTRDEALSGTVRWLDLTPPEFRHLDEWAIAEVRRTGTHAPFEKEYFHKDGHRVPVLIATAYLGGSEDTGIGFIVDLTDRKRAEAALQESEEKFRTLADNIGQLAWMTDETGWIFWYNKRWFDYTGTTLEEMQGWGWQKVHHPEYGERVTEKFRRCVTDGEIWEDTFPLRSKEGEYRWFLSRAFPIRNAEGKITRWFGTNTDITEQKRTEERLQRAMTETHHRVKNNLQLVVALLDLQVMNTEESLVPVEELNTLRGQIETLAAIHDLLTQQAREDGQAERISAGAILRKLLPLLQRSTSGRAFAFEIIEDTRLTLRQGTSLALVTSELVSNAFKHGRSQVDVTFVVRDGTAQLTVVDDGPGFPPDFDVKQAAHTGLDLVEHLVHWDMVGKTTYANRSEGGGHVTVRFPVEAN